MNKESSKKIYSTMIKLIAIIVSIFVFSYAWFVTNKENYLDNIEIGTVKSNNLQISQTGEDGWGSVLSINSLNEFVFNNDVSSNGISFYKAVNIDDSGNPTKLVKAMSNKDYLDFDLWFKNDSNVSIYLDKNSSVYPECCSNINDAVLNINNTRDEIIRVSSYGDFSRDLIASAVRIAFINYNYNESTETYELEDKPIYIWAPNKNYEISYKNGYYDFDIDSTNYETYSYMNVISSSSFNETKLTNVKDEINASYESKSSNGDQKLFEIKSNGEEVKSGLKVRIWVEGTDREAVEALKGGKFKFTLSFVGFTKEENNNIPSITVENNILVGLNETMEYSVDNGVNWIGYKSGSEVTLDDRIILVRYMETDNNLASSYVTVGGNNE